MGKIKTRWIVGCLVAVLGVACSSTSAGGDGGAGADGGGGAPATCDGVCSAMMSQKCFYGGGDADCRMSCNGWETQSVNTGPDYCKQAWSDWKSCMASQKLTCVDDSNPDWNAAPCRGHWDHVQNYCINKNAMPSTPCVMSNPTLQMVLDQICSGVPGKTHGKSCFGDAPAGCVVGGTANNSNTYCCP